MSKNLGIKLIRDLKENAVQFLAIFLMCFFAMFIMEAFDSVVSGLGKSVDEYFFITNFMDVYVEGESFSREDLSLVQNLPAVKKAELRHTVNGKINLNGVEKNSILSKIMRFQRCCSTRESSMKGICTVYG